MLLLAQAMRAIPIKIAILLFTSLFVNGCTSYCGWSYQEIKKEEGLLNSARLAYDSTAIQGISLEFQSGCYGILGYAYIMNGQIAESTEFPTFTPIAITTSEKKHLFWGFEEEGKQRILLPNAATLLILETLAAGENITVNLNGFYGQFEPENFAKYYSRFS